LDSFAFFVCDVGVVSLGTSILSQRSSRIVSELVCIVQLVQLIYKLLFHECDELWVSPLFAFNNPCVVLMLINILSSILWCHTTNIPVILSSNRAKIARHMMII